MTVIPIQRHRETYRAAWDAFKEEEHRARAPLALEARVMRAARDAREPRWRRRPLNALSACIAAAALLAIVVTGVFVQQRSEWTTESNFDEPLRATSIGPALVTLALDPVADTESMQLVRVRLSRAEAVTLGIAAPAPDSADLLYVDVLVADDGLPRDIRGVEPAFVADAGGLEPQQ